MEILSIGRSVFDLFFPHRCVNCNSVISGENPICIFCTSNLPYTHWKFGIKNPAYHKVSSLCRINSAYSLLFFEHDNVTQSLLHSLKYENQTKIGTLLGERATIEFDLNSFDGIIPVPIHPKKLKKRGYNQVMTFAEALSEKFEIPLIEDFLIRIENNPSQVFKNRAKRLNSIQNAFTLTNKNLEGHFILVDDVLTTGATVSTCINLIHSKFPKLKISVMTMAYAI